MIAAGIVLTPTGKSEELKNEEPFPLLVTVTTETDTEKHSDSDDCKISMYFNDLKENKVFLDNPGQDDFRIGALDSFSGIKVPLPLEKIEKVTLQVEAGADAWRLKRISLQFFQGNRKTDVITFPGKISLSKDRKDRACKEKVVFVFSESKKGKMTLR